ncbi:securin [Mantella aurantiaca]
MATVIFVEQENGDVASTTLSKNCLKQASSAKPLYKTHPGKVFSRSGTVKPRKALGNVNKQAINTAVSHQKGSLKLKKAAPVTKQTSEACIRPSKQNYPEIEKCLPYDPADFETFNVPEEHKLSHLCLAGIPLVVHDKEAAKFDALMALGPAPMDIPGFSGELDISSTLQSFLATIDDITIDLPQMELLKAIIPFLGTAQKYKVSEFLVLSSMATIIINHENGNVASTLYKPSLNLIGSAKPIFKSQPGKVFGSSEMVKPRKALGNVNTAIPYKKGALKVKSAPAIKQMSKTYIQPDKPSLPEIETCLPYDPADFETFDVPEEHKLSHLYLAGVPLMVYENEAAKFDALSTKEPSPMDIPFPTWELGWSLSTL